MSHPPKSRYDGYSNPPDANYDERTDTHSLLQEASSFVNDAWCALHEALKKSVYFEADESEVDEIDGVLRVAMKKLEKIAERYQ